MHTRLKEKDSSYKKWNSIDSPINNDDPKSYNFKIIYSCYIFSKKKYIMMAMKRALLYILSFYFLTKN